MGGVVIDGLGPDRANDANFIGDRADEWELIANLLPRLAEALEAARTVDTDLAVLFMDLDGFKAVNDTAGHATGDVVLTTIAQRLTKVAGCDGFVSRVSGDEFVLVLQGLDDRMTPPGGSVLLHRALPAGNRLEMIEGAGHNLPLEAPEAVARQLGIQLSTTRVHVRRLLLKSRAPSMTQLLRWVGSADALPG